MQVNSEINKLKRLSELYFAESKKQILHYGDCKIYKADRPFCDCGLLYRLDHLDFTLASIVFPNFNDDVYLQETGKKPPKRETKEQKESMRILEEVFGKAERPSLEILKMDYDDMYKVINTLFTPKMFPSAFKRLDRWLKQEAARE